MNGEGEFYLHYLNDIEYGAPLMDGEVTAAGHNERVIVIKSCTYYYIIPLRNINSSKPENGEYYDVREETRKKVLGPFTKVEFHQNLVAIGEDSLMSVDQKIADCQ